MVINSLNSGAKTFTAHFEDSSAPTTNLINGQIHLRDVIRRIDFEVDRKKYSLNKNPAVLIVRPRWHLDEPRVTIDNSLDFAMYFYHNAHELVKRGSGPYFYLPIISKLVSGTTIFYNLISAWLATQFARLFLLKLFPYHDGDPF